MTRLKLKMKVLMAIIIPSISNAFLAPSRRFDMTSRQESRFSSLPSSLSSTPFETLSETTVVNPQDGSACKALDNDLFNRGIFGTGFLGNDDSRTLLVVLPQLGDFDTSEYIEQICSVLPDLSDASMSLRVIGIGDVASAKRFCDFTGLPLSNLRVDPEANVHRALNLHRGPGFNVDFVPDAFLKWFVKAVGASSTDNDVDIKYASDVFRAWVNYMAMCAGIAAPGTLPEILRGYFGDKTAPERLSQTEIVRAGPISITGTRDVKIGPISYQNSWKDESGYQRPVELATVRLRSMVEVLTNFAEYVPDQRYVDWRGATFIFDSKGNTVYEYRTPGVLTYSETPRRPLIFLEPFIGKSKARNPLGLGDPEEVAGENSI